MAIFHVFYIAFAYINRCVSSYIQFKQINDFLADYTYLFQNNAHPFILLILQFAPGLHFSFNLNRITTGLWSVY